MLRYDSCHPCRKVHSLPYSQMLRAKRIVDNESVLPGAMREMSQGFRERGYPQKVINEHKEKVLDIDRGTLLHRRRVNKSSSRLPFISTYNDLSPKISRILNKHWPIMRPIIYSSFPEIEEFKAPPLMSYRRSRNLNNHLMKSEVQKNACTTQKYIHTPKMGSFPCLGCVNCRLMNKGSSFQLPDM